MRWCILPTLLFGCAASGPAVTPMPREAVRAQVESVTPVNSESRTSSVQVHLNVYNPSSEPLRLRRVEYVLDTSALAGRMSGEVVSNDVLESEQVGALVFEVDIPLGEEHVRMMLADALPERPAELSGVVWFEDGTQATFGQKAYLNLPYPPRFALSSIRANSVDPASGGIQVRFVARVENRNPFSIFVRSVTYAIEVEGFEVGQQVVSVGSTIGPGQTDAVDGSVELYPGHSVNLSEVAKAGRLVLRAKGSISTGAMTVPFDQEYSVAVE